MSVAVVRPYDGQKYLVGERIVEEKLHPEQGCDPLYPKGRKRKKQKGRRRRALRKFLMDQDPHCKYCRRKLSNRKDTFDHVIPKSQGGKSDESNIVLACNGCNNAKGDLSAEEFIQKLRRGLVYM